MDLITLCDKLQDMRKYLIQRYIKGVSQEIVAINSTMELLKELRAEAELKLEGALTKRSEMK